MYSKRIKPAVEVSCQMAFAHGCIPFNIGGSYYLCLEKSKSAASNAPKSTVLNEIG